MNYYLIFDKFLKPKKAAINIKIVIPPSMGTHGGGQQLFNGPPGAPGPPWAEISSTKKTR